MSEAVLAALVDGGFRGQAARVTSEDSFVPLGEAAATVLLSQGASRPPPAPWSGDAGRRPILLVMRSGHGWLSYGPISQARGGPPAGDDDFRPELADVGRLARRLVRRTVSAARAEESSIGHLLAISGPAWPRCR